MTDLSLLQPPGCAAAQPASNAPAKVPHGVGSPAPIDADDARFIGLLDAFRPLGGIAALRELERRARATREGQALHFAQWLSEGKLFALHWNGAHWFPLFQFRRVSMAPEPAMAHLLAELRATHDAWEFAAWLARPNGFLQGSAPASVIRHDAAAVVRAARADRFLCS